MTSSAEISIYDSIFTIIKEDRVSELESSIHQLSDVNFSIKNYPDREEFCVNSPPIISVACYFGSINCFRYLFNHGAVLSIADTIGRLPVHYAAAGGSMPICDELDNLGADFQALDTSGQSVIHYACKFGHTSLVQKFYLRGFDLESPDIKEIRPIHLACYNNNTELLSFLCEQSVDIECSTRFGDTPLKIILKLNELEMLKVLISYHVNTNIQDPIEKMTPIMTSIRNNSIDLAEILISSPETNVQIEDSMGWTALHYAAEAGLTDICPKLIKKGANINSVTMNNMTPLHLALNRQKSETAKYLESEGGLVWV
ncbi:hypothetical protein TVAG_434760 [Trichomonas vaginalis G3]|uniref:Uncharacterized protein n=1 Tax=Trichomonas vaginalis (strain ATCC PRA-98 / G3) TaxID=412133 RepID=A2DSQ9_TRIV3|nr:spectrin binding [Trichomonas vaginalis G3]EAY16639.1 hypothetical protein TVAG_434760 [Trichomonas vaginalis G3]KAI5533018.1 spectrin binding [Trichomonas vaginalis G3]|eukprot:XP_001328862.1 hypothetical protein [Trichomonas vaginalis G3]